MQPLNMVPEFLRETDVCKRFGKKALIMADVASNESMAEV
jgi:hypothetical protein